MALAVLADHLHRHPVDPLAEVGRVLKQPLPAPCIVTIALVTGASGTVSKVVRMPPLIESTRPTRSNWIGWWAGPLQGADHVGQFVARGAQVDRAFQRVIEQRAGRFDVAVDRARRAGIGGELHPGADRADVGLVEELRVRQGDHGAGDVGFAGLGGEDRAKARVGAAVGRAEEAGV